MRPARAEDAGDAIGPPLLISYFGIEPTGSGSLGDITQAGQHIDSLPAHRCKYRDPVRFGHPGTKPRMGELMGHGGPKLSPGALAEP